MTYYYGGYNCYGYDKYGYDRDGYNKYGRDCDGYDRGGYDKGGYDRGGRDCDGYDRGGYDCDGYDRGGRDCDGYDKSGYDCDGYDRGGRDCDGYDKGGYDCDGYDRGGYDCDGYDRDGKDCDGKGRGDQDCGDGSGDACEPEVVVLLTETFDGTCSTPDTSDQVVSDGGWLKYYDAAYTDGCRDGEMVFAEVDATECDTVEISFDMAVGNVCNWESTGSYADDVTVELLVDGAWVLLDVFTRDGDVLVGSESGQEISNGVWSDISYTVDGGSDVQLRITSDISAQDEYFWLDNVEITGVKLADCEPEPEPEPCDPEPDCTSATFVIEGEIDTEFTLTEQEDGTLLVEVKQLAGDTVGDLRGLFFDIADETLLNGMSIVGDEITCVKIDADGVARVTRGVNIKGEVLNEFGKFDIGVAIGESGLTDDIREVSFVLSSTSGPIEVEDFENMDVAVRYQSVGEEGGCRDDSLKIGGNSGEFVCDCPLGSLGDYVWVDADLDGQQGAGETGVAGVEVELFLDGVSTGRTTTTDADGFYLFEDLEAGDYNVVFTAIPEGYAFTLQNLGDDASDSDVDVNGVSDVVSLGEGEDYRDLDAGIYDLSSVVVLGSLGDYVWIDADRDGIQDAGEAGVEGVIAELFLDGVSTGLTTTTDANGFYLFDELEAGNYSVQFSATPAGYEFTAADQGGDDLADSDADASGQTGTYALAEGEDYMGLDAGLVLTRGSIGDTVWFDDDRDGVQDAGEAGVEGATVELFLDGVSTGRTTTTDASGFYLFDELDAGNYSVLVSGTPEGYEFTAADQGGDNLADSDVDASGASETYALAQGEDYMGLDAGIVVTLPTVAGDELDTCWNVTKTIDVLANDDAGLTITQIDGQDIAVGGSVAVSSGATVTLNADGTLTYDGTAVWTELGFGTMGMEMFTYTAENALGGAATAMVDVHVCADNIRTLEDINDIKPDVIEFTIDDLYLQSLEGFVVDVNVVDTGDADLDAANDRFELTASTDVFCIDVNGEVLDDVTLQAELFLADENDASLSEYVVNVHNLDLVTYILNQDYVSQGYSITDVQNAIWNLTDDLFILFDPNASAIVADAQANGEGFEAGEGDLVGLIIAPIQEVDPVTGEDTSDYQNFIYGVEYQTFTECLCV